MDYKKSVADASRKKTVELLAQYCDWSNSDNETERIEAIEQTAKTMMELSTNFAKSMLIQEGETDDPDLRTVLVESTLLSLSLIEIIVMISELIDEKCPEARVMPVLTQEAVINGIALGVELSEINDMLNGIFKEQN